MEDITVDGQAIRLVGVQDPATLYKDENNLLPIKVIYAPIENNRKLQWKAMLDLDLKDVDYHNCCKAMEDRKVIRHAYLGGGKCTLFSMREGVRQAQECYCIENDEVNMWTNSVK